MNYLSLRLMGLLSMTLLTLGCSGKVVDPVGSNGSTSAGSSGASGAGGGTATGGDGAGAGGSGAATSSSSGGAVAILACTSKAISFASDVAPRLKEGCSGACHQGAFETPEGIYGYLVGQAAGQCADGRLNVAPGDPEGSYLIDKITNQDLCAGKPMPKSLGNGEWMPLPSEDIQVVYDWICSGAKND